MFGPDLQIAADGKVIPTNAQLYVWVDLILQKLARPVNPLPPLSTTEIDNHLQVLVRGMHSIAGQNVLSGVYLFGMFVYPV